MLPPRRSRARSEFLGVFLSLSLVVITCAVQWIFWQYIQPTRWLLFFPAMLFSALRWRAGGYASTLSAATLVAIFFMPHTDTFPFIGPHDLLLSAIFTGGGLVTSYTLNAARYTRMELKFHSEVLTNLAEGVMIVDTQNSKILFTNPRFDDLFGYSAGELPGQHVSVLNAKDSSDPRARAQEIDEQLKKEGKWSGEVQNAKKDGTPFWCFVRITTFSLNTADEVWIAVHDDITAAKEASEALALAERKFSDLAETIDEVFWMVNKDKTQLVYVSPAFERIFERTCASLYQNPLEWVECVHPEDRRRVLESAMNQVSSGQYAEEYRIVRPDGRMRWIRDTGFTRKNRNGEVIGFAGVARDITDQKLIAEQILHSQKMESIGTLASGVAHDFNNLLGIIMGQTAWLEQNTQGETRKRIESIQQTAERGAALVRQILTFARKGETLRRSMDINALLLEFRPLISQLFPKNIHTEFLLDQNLPPLSLDSTQLHQVVMNLCVNARRAMPEGGYLTVSTRLVDGSEVRAHFMRADARQYVQVSVKDTGCGMKEEIRSRIFEPFFTTRHGGEGTGLGLAVASGIIESHSGFIRVESEPGKGSTFSVYLPVPLAPGTREHPNAARTTATPRAGNHTILVVEDEPHLLEIMKSVLSSHGYEVITAENGNAGLQLFRNGAFHAVVSDLSLPLMDGYALAREMKRIAPSVPIIIASGFFDPILKLELEGAGIRHFLQKPYRVTDLIETVRSAIEAS